MPSYEREIKIYGAVDTKDYIHFEGFCKKIYSKEKQYVNVYIDGILKQTIEANKHIKSIEKKYDIYETSGFCFEYKIEEKTIGKKHKLEFKNQYDSHLLQSPTSSLDISMKTYKQTILLKHLNENTDYREIKDLYNNNCIGFLAIIENLEDNDFINYIKKLFIQFSEITFKAFYFTEEEHVVLKQLFTFSNLEFILLDNFLTFPSNISIYIKNSAINNKVENKLYTTLLYNFENIIAIRFNNNNNFLKIKDSDSRLKNTFLYTHYSDFNFNFNKESPNKMMYEDIIQLLYNNTLSKDENLGEFEHYKKIKYSLENIKFVNHEFNIHKVYKKLMDNT